MVQNDSEKPFVDAINEFEQNFRYPDDIQFDPEFWIEHARQQIDEVEESYDEGDIEHMVVEFGDTILVCWRAMQIFGDISQGPEGILRERMNLNFDEKGADEIMRKYTEWWRNLQANKKTTGR